MAIWSLVEGPYGELIVMDSLDAMYVNAQRAGDKKLMAILEHRAEAHRGGPCHCKDDGQDTLPDLT